MSGFRNGEGSVKRWLAVSVAANVLLGVVLVSRCVHPLCAQEPKKKVPYAQWPQMNFKGVRVLIAATERLSNQGFAGASPKECENTLIVFPNVEKGVWFTNRDYGFGPVVRDIKIYYLDKEFRVLGSDVMAKETGVSVPPAGTAIAVEGLPEK